MKLELLKAKAALDKVTTIKMAQQRSSLYDFE